MQSLRKEPNNIYSTSMPTTSHVDGHSDGVGKRRKNPLISATSSPNQAPTPAPTPTVTPSLSPIAITKHDSPPSSYAALIAEVNAENALLKSRLLTLVHDYKRLREAVLAGRRDYCYEMRSSTHKRCLAESIQEDSAFALESGQFSEAVSEILVLSRSSFASYIDYEDGTILLDLTQECPPPLPGDTAFTATPLSTSSSSSSNDSPNDTEPEIFDNEDRDGYDDCFLSLTRSTTVLLVNTAPIETFKSLTSNRLNLPYFRSIPTFANEPTGYHWTFDDAMNHPTPVSELERDRYNMVTDLLEEQLLSNEMRYYTETVVNAHD